MLKLGLKSLGAALALLLIIGGIATELFGKAEVQAPKGAPEQNANVTVAPKKTQVPWEEGNHLKLLDENFKQDSRDYQPEKKPQRLISGTHAVKRWQVQNTGTLTWTGNYGLVKAESKLPSGGTNDGCPLKIPAMGGHFPILTPGQKGQIAVPVTGPNVPGVYQVGYRLVNDKGVEFGDTLWIVFEVKEAPKTVTPTPSTKFR